MSEYDAQTVDNLDSELFNEQGDEFADAINAGLNKSETQDEAGVPKGSKSDDEFAYLDEAPEDASDSDSDEHSEEDEEVQEKRPPRKKSKGYYAAINLRNQQRDRERLEQIARENAELKGRLEGLQSSMAGTPQKELTEEEIAERWVQERVAAQMRAEHEKLERERAERQERAEAEKRHADWQRELDRASGKYNDFDAKVRDNPSIMNDATLQAAVQLIPNRIDVLRHLGHDRNALYDIQSLNGIEQVRALVALSNKIEAAKAARQNKVPHNPTGFEVKQSRASGNNQQVLRHQTSEQRQSMVEQEGW